MKRNLIIQTMIGLLILSVHASRGWGQTGWGQTGWGQAPTGQIQKVLFIISDDLKASVLPAYGNQVCQTPNLDRLAESGMVFERDYCQGLPTVNQHY